jgi:hypothetical protein
LRKHTKRIRTRRSRSLGGFRCKYNGIWPKFRCDRLIFCKIKRPNQSRNGLKIEGTNIDESILYPGNWGYQVCQINLLLILTKYIAATSLLLRKQDLWLKAIIVVQTAMQEHQRLFNSALVRVRLYLVYQPMPPIVLVQSNRATTFLHRRIIVVLMCWVQVSSRSFTPMICHSDHI